MTCPQVLPNITPGNIWDSELLDALTEANNLGIFQSEVVEAAISAAWEQMRAYTALDIGARLLTVIVSWRQATQRHQGHAGHLSCLVPYTLLTYQNNPSNDICRIQKLNS